MKIGILTLHSGANYGGTLQCLALYKILQTMGHDVEVVDFKPQFACSLVKRILYNVSSVRSFKELYSILKHKSETANQKINKELCAIFDTYRKTRISFSTACNELSISDIAMAYDVIIVGSDQVWASTVRSHLSYMGDWTPPFRGHLYSYAACATKIRYPILRKRKIIRLLNKFSGISVRDEYSKKFVEQFVPQNRIRIDLDPTLLYNFDNMCSSKSSQEKYILVYVLGKEISGGNEEAIKRIKNMMDCDMKVIAITIYDEEVRYADKTIKNATPEDWMWYIKNAQFIFTDSFHGEVFSIKFKKNFYVYYVEENRSSRIKALSQMFHMENRMITSVEGIKSDFKYKIYMEDFEKLKESSLSYLESIK